MGKKLTLLEHLRSVAESAKGFTNKHILRLTETTIAAIEEVDTAKADKTDVAQLQEKIDSVENNKFSLYDATTLEAGNDLNGCITPGFYKCISASVAKELLNCPHTVSGFGMYVVYTATKFWVRQIILPNQLGISQKIYHRTIYTLFEDNVEASDWYEHALTKTATVNNPTSTPSVMGKLEMMEMTEAQAEHLLKEGITDERKEDI